MTRQHFEKIAAILNEEFSLADNEGERHIVLETALALAEYFETQNARFDRVKFLDTCAGLGKGLS